MRTTSTIRPRPLLAMLLPSLGLANAFGLENFPNPPTFARDIAPLLAANCVECHHPRGTAPFSLLSYDQAERRAREIAEVTASRFMPPWKPAAGHGPPLQGTRQLTTGQIALLQAWYEHGALPGDLTALPPIPSFDDGWRLGEPDLILHLPAAYTLPADGQDIYRNFVLPVPIKKGRFVRAVEIRPGSTRTVHHALLLVDQSGWATREDAADPLPGFSGMELAGATTPPGHLIGWTAGQIPFQAYPGTAWQIEPDTSLILQLHLLPSGKTESIAPTVGLYFTDQPPTRTTQVLILRERQLDIPAGAPDYSIEESIVLPIRTRALGLYPHAHYLGKDLQIYADLPGGERRWLLRIPDWDFNWQRDYRFAEPLELPAGARLTMRYVYDNSAANPRNPHQPPVRVRQGWRATDEMGEVAVQLLLENHADRATLAEADLRYRMTAMGRPEFFVAAGEASEARGNLIEARQAYLAALHEDPGFAPALSRLGLLAENEGDLVAAATWFEKEIHAGGEREAAELNRARVLHKQGDLIRAQAAVDAVLARHPASADARLLLVSILRDAGLEARASEQLKIGLDLNPASPALNLEMAKLMLRSDRTETARRLLAAASVASGADSPRELQIRQRTIHADALLLEGMLEQRQGRLGAAAAKLEDALLLAPAHRGALVLLAAIRAEQDDEAAATANLIKVLSLPPANRPSPDTLLGLLPFPTGVRALIRACHERGDVASARLLMQRAVALAESRKMAEPLRGMVKLRQELGL